MKINSFWIFGILIAMCSCSTINSSINFTKGTRCLEAGNYKAAISYLEKAVQLDPTTSRNQNNLANAYAFNGNIDKAWVHVRKAVGLDCYNKEAVFLCTQIYQALVEENGLNKESIAKEHIIAALGTPDFSFIEVGGENERESHIYGNISLVFEKGKLVNESRIF